MAKLKLGTNKDFDVTNQSDTSLYKIDYDGVHDLNATTIEDVEAAINAQTGTTYELTAGDSGKLITLSNAAGITVTIPQALLAGWHAVLIQIGAGQVTFAGGGSMTIRNRQSHTKIAGQYGVVSLVVYATNNVALAGDTSS